MAYPKKKTLADIPPRPVRTIAVYRTDPASRWSDPALIDKDSEQIAAVYGPLNTADSRNLKQAFHAYVLQHLSPETVTAVYNEQHFYRLAFNAFVNRSRFDAKVRRLNKKSAPVVEAVAA